MAEPTSDVERRVATVAAPDRHRLVGKLIRARSAPIVLLTRRERLDPDQAAHLATRRCSHTSYGAVTKGRTRSHRSTSRGAMRA